jgi:HEAT repeat protein
MTEKSREFDSVLRPEGEDEPVELVEFEERLKVEEVLEGSGRSGRGIDRRPRCHGINNYAIMLLLAASSCAAPAAEQLRGNPTVPEQIQPKERGKDAASLFAQLTDEDPEVRLGATSAFGSVGSVDLSSEDENLRQTIIAALVMRLGDTSATIRAEAAESLEFRCKVGDTNVVMPLIATLNDPDPSVKINVMGVLKKIGDERAVEPLIEKLRDENDRVRAEAINALGVFKDHPKVKPALNTTLQDKSSYVKATAAIMLGGLGDINAIPALIEIAGNELGLYVPEGSWERASEMDDNINNTGFSRSMNIGNILITEHTTFTAEVEQESVVMREYAIETLAQFNDERALKTLLKASEDGCIRLRYAAVSALGKFNDQRVINALIKRLDDEDEEVRNNAVRVLGKLKNPSTASSLARKIDDPKVSYEAVNALENMGDRNSALLLLRRLDLEKDKEFKPATDALLRLIEKNPSVLLGLNGPDLDMLIRALDNEKTKYNAAIILGSVADSRMIPVLVKRISVENDGNVLHILISALAQIKGREAIDALTSLLGNENARYDIINELEQRDKKEVIPVLTGRLSDESVDSKIRCGTAIALGGFRDSKSVDALVKIVKKRNEDPEVKKAAISSLKYNVFSNDRGEQALFQALEDNDPGVRKEAVLTLESMIGQSEIKSYSHTVSKLIERLKDDDVQVRLSAVSALQGCYDKRILPSLGEMLGKETDENVKKEIEKAILCQYDGIPR